MDRLVIISIMVADKLYSDAYFRNTDYALVGGLSITELNGLEHEFVAMVAFDLYINDLKYETYYDKLKTFASAQLFPPKPPLPSAKHDSSAVSQEQQHTEGAPI